MTSINHTHPSTSEADGDDPTQIDWPARQAAAAIPFEVVDGRPVNPHAPTGVRRGRGELWHWGERVNVDVLLTVTDDQGQRWVLLIERGDGHGWALPGGGVDANETPRAAAARELEEETGLVLDPSSWRAGPVRYVPDPRASDEAWMVTIPCRADLGVQATFPVAVAGSDAGDAIWAPVGSSLNQLADWLERGSGGDIFPAHRELLADVLYAGGR